MRSRILSAWSKVSAKYPGRVIIGAIIITIAAMYVSKDLGMSMLWSDLLPENNPQVMEFEKILDEYDSASNSIVVIKGPEESIKRFADELAPQLRALDEDVKKVTYKIEKDFILNHGFMLTKEKYLKDMTDTFKDFSLAPLLTTLNDNFEKVYTGDEESLSNKEKENEAVNSLDGIEFFLTTMREFAEGNPEADEKLAEIAAERYLMGEEYMISPDKKWLIMMIDPAFSMEEMERAVANVDTMQVILNRTMENYPDIHAGLTGLFPLQRDEMFYSLRDLKRTSIVAMTAIMLLFIISFRMVSTPLLAGLNLIIAIIWTAGLAKLLVGDLNMMTSMFAVILIGLGIDFSIHILSVYNEMRKEGRNIPDAVRNTLLKSGAGIITGGLTTACAFLTIMVSQTKGMREMGLVLGIGILTCMVTTIFVFPAILVMREKVMMKIRAEKYKVRSVDFKFLENTGVAITRKPKAWLIVGLILTVVFFYQALKVKFDYNYYNMEPKGLESVALQDSMIEAFDMSPDFLMITAETLDKARRVVEDARDMKTVGLVSSLSDYVPSSEDQEKRRVYVREIRENLSNRTALRGISESEMDVIIAQLERLDMNIYELGQMAYLGGQDKVDRKIKQLTGDPEDENSVSLILSLMEYLQANKETSAAGLNKFQRGYEPKMEEIALRMANLDEITIDDVPESIKHNYMNKSGDKMLISIYPTQQMWDFEFLERFVDQMSRVDPHITGMPPLQLTLMEYYGEDGKKATVLTLIVVFLLLLVDYRDFKMAIMGMVPLVFGVIWMMGMMKSMGMMLTYVNIMAIPMIVGIGIDDGVHILHRYRVEGPGKIPKVLASTGKAVLLTSLTTMCGFGSLMLAEYRGFASMGSLLVLGVGACFLTTVIVLMSMLAMREKGKVKVDCK
ncbi:MAG: MMPL family transporter [FCB group bacterium]|nr:MMPL family transporter [FCB group bacterium]